MRIVFNCGDINQDGVCRCIAARWIFLCKKKGGAVTSAEELGSRSFLNLLWDAAKDDEHIDKNNLLQLTSKVTTTAGQAFSPVWMATHLTLGGRPAIITCWDNSLRRSPSGMRKRMEGHSMAAQRIGGKLQFLDPNTCCWEFNNALEFYDFLPGYLSAGLGGPAGFSGYPDLLRHQGIVYKYK